MTKRRVFSSLRRLYVNLLLTGGLMRDLHRVKFTGKGRDVYPFDGKIRTPLCQCLRSYVFMFISREDSLSSVMILRRGVFSLFTPLKLRSVAQVDTGYVSNEG